LKNLFKSYIHSIEEIEGGFCELVIKSPLLAKKLNWWQFVKIQNYLSSSVDLIEPIPLSPVKIDKENDLVHFVIEKVGLSTKMLCESSRPGDQILAVPSFNYQPFNIFDLFSGKKVLFLCERISNYLNLILFQEVSKISDVLFFNKFDDCVSHDVQKINRFYDYEDLDDVIEEYNSPSDRIIVWGLKSFWMKEKKAIFVRNNTNKMQCMMNGICGRCIKSDGSGGYVFMCGRSRYFVE
jgi:hypothetical protein